LIWKETNEMMKAFTRNYYDNSTEAGFQFTFYCDICGDGYKSSFIESETYDKKQKIQGVARGAGVLGSLIGGIGYNTGWAAERAGDVMAERFEERSPEWRKEYENAFNRAQNEAQQYFHRCHACQKWVCDSDWNEDEGMCVDCAPRTEIYAAKAKADAIKRNIDEKAEEATIWKGDLKSTTTVCPSCGKPAGSGKFCNNCGASLELNKCPACGAENAQGVRFCNQCGAKMDGPKVTKCPGCGKELEPGAKFCGECGTKIE